VTTVIRTLELITRAADLVATRYSPFVDPANKVQIEAGGGELVDVNIHGVQPDTLDVLVERGIDAEPHHDVDGILKWVEVKDGAVTLTWFRR
jgi:hypothetical protein